MWKQAVSARQQQYILYIPAVSVFIVYYTAGPLVQQAGSELYAAGVMNRLTCMNKL